VTGAQLIAAGIAALLLGVVGFVVLPGRAGLLAEVPFFLGVALLGVGFSRYHRTRSRRGGAA